MSNVVCVTDLWKKPKQLIPSDWSVKKLVQVTLKITDRDHTTPKYVERDKGVPIVSPTNLNSDMRLDLTKLKYITPEAHEKNRKKTDLKPKDIIFSRIGAGLGKSYLLDESFFDFSILHSFCQIRVDKQIEPEYLLWFLRSDYLQWRLKYGIQSIGVPDLGLKEIGELPIFIPECKKEQKKIAAILTSVDDVIEKTQAQIDKLKDLKTGMMQELLTRGVGVDGKPHTEFKDSPVGRIPKGWEVKSIIQVLERVIDYRGKSPPKSDSGLPLLTAKNIRKGFINPEPKEFIPFEKYEDWMVRGVPTYGDVFITTEAPLGNVARVPKYKFAIGQRVLALCPKGDLLDTDFLVFVLQSESFVKQLDLQSTGSTVAGIKQSTFKNILLPVPSLGEQVYIAGCLKSNVKKCEGLEVKLTKLKDIKKALMQDLLTGKKRVKVDS